MHRPWVLLCFLFEKLLPIVNKGVQKQKHVAFVRCCNDVSKLFFLLCLCVSHHYPDPTHFCGCFGVPFCLRKQNIFLPLQFPGLRREKTVVDVEVSEDMKQQVLQQLERGITNLDMKLSLDKERQTEMVRLFFLAQRLCFLDMHTPLKCSYKCEPKTSPVPVSESISPAWKRCEDCSVSWSCLSILRL